VSDRLVVKRLTSAIKCTGAIFGCANFPVEGPIFSSALDTNSLDANTLAQTSARPINRSGGERQGHDG
jgi:hypothetical protein